MTSTSKQARQRVPAAERRDALIAAAIEEFAVGGLHGTPVDRIARRVGVAQPYVFSLFPTKRDLFIAAVDRGFEIVMELFSEAAEQFRQVQAGGEHERGDLLGALGDSYIELLATNRPKLMFQLQAYAACEDETIRERVGAAYRRLQLHVREVTGASEDEVNEFLSHGMWLNVQAALQIMDLDAACEWIRERRELNRAGQPRD
ncbi:MAG TPA: TetR/AcrR family transcriptional regulator [Solirubrobacteraceae bacterium]|nr:TetR/AcrR family transcriptional regulator [Solirubrobacteraceae bacterium]